MTTNPLQITKLHFASCKSLHQCSSTVIGKTVLITGGGGGIGSKVALRFAIAGAGTVILLGRQRTTLEEAAARIRTVVSNCTVVIFVVDICDALTLSNVFKAVTQTHSCVDILINNAAHYPVHASALSTDDDVWRAFEVNVRGTLNVTREFAEQVASGTRTPRMVLNITSASAYAFHARGAAMYSASKLAAIRMMEALAAERTDLRVINVHPGAAKSQIYQKAGGESVGIPLNDENLVGDFLVWLSGPDAAFLHGRTVEVNWDIQELKHVADVVVSEDCLKCYLRHYPLDEDLWLRLSQSQSQGTDEEE